jgi:undecaprenyl-diphosphatase
MTFVVNAGAGSASRLDLDELLARELPEAEIIEADGEQLDAALSRAAEASVLGIAGGDGTINAAAETALRAGKPLVVLPAGTLNHFARDLGIDGPDDSVSAIRAGHAIAVDVGMIDGRPFLNTASFGSYSELVDAREALEDRIGKWPALVVAFARVLHRSRPVRVEIDGVARTLWMVFIGNGAYQPKGFVPARRERLDEGVFDVRLVDGAQPWARLRILVAVMTRRLARSPLYDERLASRLEIHSLDGPLRLARDGETFDGGEHVVVCKASERLAVYVPEPE